MKTKLLRRLRKRFVVAERSGEYKLIDRHNSGHGWSTGYFWNIDKNDVEISRRSAILHYAISNYKKPKKII